MKGQNKSFVVNMARPYYLSVFIVLLMLCVKLTNAAIATSHIQRKVNTTSKGIGTPHQKPTYADREIPCPKYCICDNGVDSKEITTLTCRRAGIKLFPTIPRKEISSVPWRLAEKL